MIATSSNLQPWRCPKCGRLLARLAVQGEGTVEIVCERCGTVNALRVEAPQTQPERRLFALNGL